MSRDDISSNLGWVNAERAGLLKAMKALPQLSTEWNFGGDMDGGMPHSSGEEERDGRFTCEACGRSTCAANFLTLVPRF